MIRVKTDKYSKQLPDRIMDGQKFGQKSVKPLRIEKNRNGQKRNRSSTMLDDSEECISLIQTTEYSEILKNARRKLERPVAPAMPCKRHPSIVKTRAKPKIGNEKEFKTMYDCIVESQESTRQRAEPLRGN